jgi:hypothetical protein
VGWGVEGSERVQRGCAACEGAVASRRMLRHRRACVLWPWEWSDTVCARWEGAVGLLLFSLGQRACVSCVWAGWLHQQPQLVRVLWVSCGPSHSRLKSHSLWTNLPLRTSTLRHYCGEGAAAAMLT